MFYVIWRKQAQNIIGFHLKIYALRAIWGEGPAPPVYAWLRLERALHVRYRVRTLLKDLGQRFKKPITEWSDDIQLRLILSIYARLSFY